MPCLALNFIIFVFSDREGSFMECVDIGTLARSSCFAFTPPELARDLYFYPTWCGHYFCTSAYYMKRKSYPPLLVVYVREGSFHFEYREMVFDAQKGDVVLLDCSEPHYYRAYDGLEFLYMHFDGSNSHEICQHILSQHGPLIRRESNILIGNLLHDMVELYRSGGIETMFQSSMRIYQLFEYLLAPDSHQYEKETPVEDAIRYIRAHMAEQISLEDLADEANLSVYYFAHIFKEKTGLSPIEFVINTRLDRAKILLAHTSRSVEEIACEVGYSSASSLTNIFKRRLGVPPGQYRKMYRDPSA